MAEHIHRFVQSLDIWEHPWYRYWAKDDLDEYCDFVRSARAEARHRGRLPARARGPRREPARRAAVGLRRRLGPLHGRGCGRRARRARLGVLGHLARRGPRQGLVALLRDARRGGADRHVRHPGPPRSREGVRARVPVPEGDLRRFYERAMDGIAECDVAVEVSTAGLRKPAGEIYPAAPFLEMCLEAGPPGGAVERRAHAGAARPRVRAGGGVAGRPRSQGAGGVRGPLRGGWSRSDERRARVASASTPTAWRPAAP